VITGADWLKGPFRWRERGEHRPGVIQSGASNVVIGSGRPSVPWVLLSASQRSQAGARVHASPAATVPGDPEHDRALMRRVREGDENAFAALYDRYAAQVNGVALSILRRPALAEDVTHDVFLRLWQQPALFDPARGNFVGWLLRVTRNRAIDVLRRQREGAGNGPDGDVASWMPDPGPGPEDEAIDGMRQQTVHQALGTLSADHRQLLELAYFAGLSQSQIADHLGRPLGTVKSQIRAAMARLAEQLASSRETIDGHEGLA
jgi:RNA polymerase sigma-70 factor (ECF subfamily)